MNNSIKRLGQLPAMIGEAAAELRNTIHRSRHRRHRRIRTTASASPAATATVAERLLGITVAGFLIPIASFPATLLVGLCFGLPLFPLVRERALSHS